LLTPGTFILESQAVMATRRTMEWDTPLGRMLVTSPQILDQAKRFILLAVTNALAYFAQPSTKKKSFLRSTP